MPSQSARPREEMEAMLDASGCLGSQLVSCIVLAVEDGRTRRAVFLCCMVRRDQGLTYLVGSVLSCATTSSGQGALRTYKAFIVRGICWSALFNQVYKPFVSNYNASCA